MTTKPRAEPLAAAALSKGPTLCAHSFPAGAFLPEHAHDEALFLAVLEGSYTETGSRPTHVTAPAVVLNPAHARHAVRVHETGVRSLSLTLPDWWLARTGVAAPTGADPVRLDRGAAWLLSGLRAESTFQDELSPLALEGLALQALAAAARSGGVPDSRPAWLDRVAERLREPGSERPTVRALARDAGVPAAHLVRSFRRRFGCSPAEYGRRARVDMATHLLAESRAPLVEIALAAGFCDQAHMTRVFKRVKGITPSRFRALAGGR